MPSTYTDIVFTNQATGGITAQKLNLLVDDLSVAIAAGGGGGTGTGDMTKAVYDTTNNAKVDHAELSDSVPWTGVTGKPSTFPPDSTAMLKSVYDTDNNGVTDHAALADAVPWTGVSSKPSTFPPDPHQASHVTGSDQIPSATTAVRGLMPVASNVANQFYASDATQKQITYAMLGGSQPAPTSHGSTHVGGASDPVPVATTTVAGLMPAKPNAGVNATSTQGVMGDDTRLNDARTPNSTLAHQASHVTGSDQIPSASISVRGLMPQANNVANNFYASDGTQKQPTYAMLGGSQPAPVAHQATHITGGSDIIPVASTSATGLAPIRSGTATTYLNGAGAYTTPAGGGDMTKAVYDTNSDNIVDQAAAAPWTGITGKPSTFPPDATAELVARKGVASGYASLDSGVLVPVAQLPVMTATVKGIVPTPPNNTTTFLRGDATFATPASGPPDFANQRMIFDDFYGFGIATTFANQAYFGSLPWQAILTGTGALVAFDDQYATSAASAFGCVICTTGTLATGVAYIQGAYLYPAKGILEMGFRVLASATPTSAQNYLLQFGLSDAAGANYIQFEGTFAVSAVIRGKTSAASTVTTGTTTALAGGAFNRYKILTNAAWTNVGFYYNGTLSGSAVTTNIPTTVKLYPWFGILKSVGTTSVSADIDQFYLNYAYVS